MWFAPNSNGSWLVGIGLRALQSTSWFGSHKSPKGPKSSKTTKTDTCERYDPHKMPAKISPPPLPKRHDTIMGEGRTILFPLFSTSSLMFQIIAYVYRSNTVNLIKQDCMAVAFSQV